MKIAECLIIIGGSERISKSISLLRKKTLEDKEEEEEEGRGRRRRRRRRRRSLRIREEWDIGDTVRGRREEENGRRWDD